jgi:hypothetical protein
MRRLSPTILCVFIFGMVLAACNSSEPTDSTPAAISSVDASPNSYPFVTQGLIPSPTVRVSLTPFHTLTQPVRKNQTSPVKTRLNPAITSTDIRGNPSRQLTLMESSSTPTLSPTPTFDIRSIRTSTPAPAAICPRVVKTQIPVPTLEYNGQFRIGPGPDVFLDFLNTYGVEALRQADQYTRDAQGGLSPHIILYRDLTNDGVSELVVSFGQLFIFGCKNGMYKTLLATDMIVHFTPQKIVAINDLNQNGIPELLVLIEVGTQDDHYYKLFEWEKGQFNSLFNLEDPYTGKGMDQLFVLSGGTFRFQDVDSDGMKEIVLHNGSVLTADYYGTAPWRRLTEYFKWNGNQFILVRKFFDPPQYRFQAVEDADQAVLAGNYDQALDLYRRVIFDDKLDWWTLERMEYIIHKIIAKRDSKPFDVTPPAPDPNEYFYLGAYARFRMMILLLMHGYPSDAQVVYQTLLDMFPKGKPGSVYAQMAQAFWEDYQVNHSVGLACGKSQVAARNNVEDPTRYLVDDYARGGWGKPPYTIEQLCPFK